ncbi:hypothetical protein TraAM80_03204 [Trypanosoma rangeli]|uniref:AB hydrolase-1 domain-containing protein n=1 Tax=Trypanosoma rangeli TaxID=5698 RepID=A0A422NQC5_TRYRA|nr:uncharacterized protein TraAM80_03204 [Trypanosoma rangeli]RNF07682.1 hypothetical protein TraAM80_03204 [Trypanosoma rangeli]|eukprot:RNF07682.1 hypothetical protein TraAM80_03204 [Trypanosoma rangeli]
MSSFSSRVIFFLIHCVVHLVFYVVPETLFNLLFRWPICLLEWMIGEKEFTLAAWKERRIAAVGSRCSSAIYDSFGLGSCTMYEGPMYGGHVHTILGSLRPSCKVDYTRETVTAEDGNSLCIDFFPLISASETAVRGLVLILPGLLGCSQSTYVRRAVTLLSREGFYVAVLNTRGVEGAPLEKAQIFGAVFTMDLRHVLKNHFSSTQVQERLKCRQPKPLIALGFSFGGVVLCKYLGEQGLRKEPSQLRAAIVFNSPYDLNEADDAMNHSLYGHSFAKELVAYADRHKTVMKQLPLVDTELLFEGNHPLLYRLRSVAQFDCHVTAPHFGFRSPEEYYSAASCFVSLLTAQVPVLCIAVRNDPICGKPPNIRRWEKLANTNANVTYIEMPSGGHMGYLGNPIAELQQKANEGERLILWALQCFCKNYLAETELGVGSKIAL